MKSMSVRERFQAVMNFQPFDRLPKIEWAMWWNLTVERWQREGLSLSDRYELYRHFDLDLYRQCWLPTRRPECPRPGHPDRAKGIIENMDDYLRLRPLLYPEPQFDEAMWSQWAAEQRRGEAVVWFTLEGFFWFPRELLGVERHLYAFYDQPELLHQINSDLADYAVKALAALNRICVPDFMTFAEDLSYNHGPMLSRESFEEFLTPYYARVIPVLRERGTLPFVDSDGDVTTCLPWFESAGLAGILPLERQAGVDLAELRRRHPRMRFIGAYDKMVMNQGEAAMRQEFERLLPVAAEGGYIFSVDHQTPPGVSLAQYRDYLRLLDEYAHKAAKVEPAAVAGK